MRGRRNNTSQVYCHRFLYFVIEGARILRWSALLDPLPFVCLGGDYLHFFFCKQVLTRAFYVPDLKEKNPEGAISQSAL
jgi:hypothetical protein